MSNFLSKLTDIGRSIRTLQDEMITEGVDDKVLINWMDYAWEIIRDVKDEYSIRHVQDSKRGG